MRLPAEGLSRRRIQRRYPGPWRLTPGFATVAIIGGRDGGVRRYSIDVANGHCRLAVRFGPAIPLRNLLFLLIVLTHGFQRLLPP